VAYQNLQAIAGVVHRIWPHHMTRNPQLRRTMTAHQVRAPGAVWPSCACDARDACAEGVMRAIPIRPSNKSLERTRER
jgi:hypothetical protein